MKRLGLIQEFGVHEFGAQSGDVDVGFSQLGVERAGQVEDEALGCRIDSELGLREERRHACDVDDARARAGLGECAVDQLDWGDHEQPCNACPILGPLRGDRPKRSKARIVDEQCDFGGRGLGEGPIDHIERGGVGQVQAEGAHGRVAGAA